MTVGLSFDRVKGLSLQPTIAVVTGEALDVIKPIIGLTSGSVADDLLFAFVTKTDKVAFV